MATAGCRFVPRRGRYDPAGMLAAVMIAALWRGSAMAAPPAMLAHRAVYDLALSAVSGGEVVTAEGKLTFVLSDMCSAWSTQQQLHLRTTGRGGAEAVSDSDYAVLEEKDGSSLIFRADQTENGSPAPRIAGEARMGPAGGRVHYTAPVAHDVALPANTLFPVAHTAAIIQAGLAGRGQISPNLFDGTVDSGALGTYVLLLGRQAPPVATSFTALAPLAAVRAHVAYYNTATRDMAPMFETGMRYFANGVADRVELDFGPFRMAGTLREFRPLPVPDHCPGTGAPAGRGAVSPARPPA
ncbi:EipB family protein [Komagataeibacter kakiaceti]